MTDIEITKLCARAMGIKVFRPENRSGWWEGSVLFATPYEPLRDDAQAMALVKRFPLETLAAMTNHIRVSANVPEMIERALGLNRAICECVAKMEKAK